MSFAGVERRSSTSSTPTQSGHDTTARSATQLPRRTSTSRCTRSSRVDGRAATCSRFRTSRSTRSSIPTRRASSTSASTCRYPGAPRHEVPRRIEQDTGIPDPTNPPPTATERAEDRRRDRVRSAIRTSWPSTTMRGHEGGDDASTASLSGDGDGAAPTRRRSRTRRAPTRRPTSAGSQMCQEFWNDNPACFEGTDRVLTAPLNGTTSRHRRRHQPVNSALAVGGAQFFVDEALAGFDTFAIYTQYDDADGDGMPDYPPAPRSRRSPSGTAVPSGSRACRRAAWCHVHLATPTRPQAHRRDGGLPEPRSRRCPLLGAGMYALVRSSSSRRCRRVAPGCRRSTAARVRSSATAACEPADGDDRYRRVRLGHRLARRHCVPTRDVRPTITMPG